jgi:transcriptional regulator with XRE-family HTH domain
MTWRENLKRELTLRKISQEAFAEKVGLTQGGLAHKLSGRRGTDVDEFLRFAEELKMPANELLNDGHRVAEQLANYQPTPGTLGQLKNDWEQLPPALQGYLSRKARRLCERLAALPAMARDSIARAPESDDYAAWERSVDEFAREQGPAHG